MLRRFLPVLLSAAFLLGLLVTGAWAWRTYPTIPVVFAAQDIPAGTQVRADMFKPTAAPRSQLPAGYFTRISELEGLWTTSPLYSGEPVSRRRVTPQAPDPMDAPGSGLELTSFPITPATALGGVLQAGDTVDVIAAPPATKADAPAPEPFILMRSVLVVDIRNQSAVPTTGKVDSGPLAAGSNNLPAWVTVRATEADSLKLARSLASHHQFTLVLTRRRGTP